MPISITRKRVPEGSGLQALKALSAGPPSGIMQHSRRQSSCPTGIIFTFLLIVWCFTTILSGSFFHICISSRKLNLYCISGGAGHAGSRDDFGVGADEASSNSSSSSSSDEWVAGDRSVDGGKDGDESDEEEEVTSKTISDVLPNSKATTITPRSFGDKKKREEVAARKVKVFTTVEQPKTTVITATQGNNTNSHDDGKDEEVTKKGQLAAIKMKLGTTEQQQHDGPAPNLTTITTNTIISEVTDPKEEKATAMKVVEGQMQRIRSWVSDTAASRNSTGCAGRGIYVYDLPTKFNKNLMADCHDGLLPWTDLCDYFGDEGLGAPIPRLGHGWHRTHQYSLEPIFHVRVQKHPCRVYDQSAAALFYVPYYGGLDVLRWHFKNNVSNEVKDALGLELLQWLEAQAPWARKQGRDHMFVLGKISWDFRRTSGSRWGSSFLDSEKLTNPYKFLLERQPWEIKDIGIPHPTNFHPHGDGDVMAWQSMAISVHRKNLIGFAGAARPEVEDNIRSLLIKQCLKEGSSDSPCKFHDCKSNGCDDPEAVIDLFKGSEFCLQPPGDSPTRKSVFDSLVAGCIPVLFDPLTAYYQYPWHLPEDHRLYSVFIDQDEVREKNVDVVERLRAFPVEKRAEMRRYIVYELMPRLVYGDSTAEFGRFRDAFGIVMENVMDVVTKYEE